jgi:light-harvesting complex I chlorophyll a/b binding protein 1
MALAMSAFTAPVLGARPFAAQPKQAAARRAPVLVRAEDPAAPSKEVPAEILEYAKTMPGISDPFPNIFDPANLLGSASSVQELRRWRESEVTHGRVAMLASLGFIVQEQLEDFPGPFPHVQGPAIDHFQQVESQGAIFWEPLVFAIGLAEAYRVGYGWAPPRSENFNQLLDDYEPGNLGFDPLGLYPSDPAAQYDLKTKELNNGRLAMIAIAAFVAQELVEKREIFEHLFVNVEKEIELPNV